MISFALLYKQCILNLFHGHVHQVKAILQQRIYTILIIERKQFVGDVRAIFRFLSCTINASLPKGVL
jgi:hypothetical protein